ncbi:PadR family transcriptional regulator [Lihuaxuella thermophila]|uniref:PadR family transcriptional regulator n=1 Tax=Lihuaxuella thermophila TaxID=1173111 RepID=UPI000B7DCF97|nr:PadR family transcriptional regulator [Lihuaxuella thermophila]
MYAEILILGQLLSGPKHGYEIKKNIQEALGEEFEINNNLLYPALRRFLEMGAISKEVVKSEGKPARHVYLLTDTGEEIFHDMIRDFPSKLAANQSEFLVRVALFDRLEPDMRREILQKRQEVLQEKLKFYRRIENTHAQNPFVVEVIRFQKAQVEHELAWIEDLKQKMT